MTNLIDRAKAARSLEQIAERLEDAGKSVLGAITRLNALWILSQPIVDAKLVRHGTWVHTNIQGYPHVKCSLCKKEAIFDGTNKTYLETPYCPNCGEKMDGGKNSERITFDIYA